MIPAMRSRICRSSCGERHTPLGWSEAVEHHWNRPSWVLELGAQARSLTRHPPSSPRANWKRVIRPWLLFSYAGDVSVTVLPSP